MWNLILFTACLKGSRIVASSIEREFQIKQLAGKEAAGEYWKWDERVATPTMKRQYQAPRNIKDPSKGLQPATLVGHSQTD